MRERPRSFFSGDEEGQDALQKLIAAEQQKTRVANAKAAEGMKLQNDVCDALVAVSTDKGAQKSICPVHKPHLGALAWPSSSSSSSGDQMSIGCTTWAPELGKDAAAAWQRMACETRQKITSDWKDQNTMWHDQNAIEYNPPIRKRLTCFYAGFCTCMMPRLQAYICKLQSACRRAFKKGTDLHPIILNGLAFIHIHSTNSSGISLWLHISHADRSVWRVAARKMEKDSSDSIRQLRLIQAMVNAAKSDGEIDAEEQQKIVSNLGDEVSDEERQFVISEMQTPLDADAFIRSIPRGAEMQVYMMSLLGINLDSQKEAVYLDSLRKGIGMSEQQCNAIHEKLGVPTIYS